MQGTNICAKYLTPTYKDLKVTPYILLSLKHELNLSYVHCHSSICATDDKLDHVRSTTVLSTIRSQFRAELISS